MTEILERDHPYLGYRGPHGQALLYTSGELSQRACAPFTLPCHVGVVIPYSKEGPLFMTTALLGEPMVDVLRR